MASTFLDLPEAKRVIRTHLGNNFNAHDTSEGRTVEKRFPLSTADSASQPVHRVFESRALCLGGEALKS
jgi:hypothetical protein